MNKTAIKNFAVSARTKLMDAVQQKAYELGITKNEIKEPETYEGGFRINEKFFKGYELKQRNKLIQKIEEKGFDQVIEEVAYTWFNRFIAIRFMEVNEYLPTGVRVLSSAQEGKIEPDVIGEVTNIAGELELNLDIVYRLQDENKTEDLFKYILVKQCNKLGEIMPMMFEQIQDYTELLLPDNLLAEGSVVRDLVSKIDEEDWKEQVEIIGWLYQYYISEKKDEVFADLDNNKKITKENIPAATQLFTPKWIVKYMVENSLGRLWLESHPNEELQQQWKYYLEEAEQEPEVQEQLEKLKNKELKPEDITVLDPCMGSGHILVYAFDVLYSIYQHAGYSEREIPQLILEKNLYGLDIDDRAAQLAYFALMMKARSYNRRIFQKKIKLNLSSIQESNDISQEVIEYFVGDSLNKTEVEYLINVFLDAKEYGSILEVEAIAFDLLEKRIEDIRNNGEFLDIFNIQYKDIILEKIPLLIKQAKILSGKYHIVTTNPPYMGYRGMNQTLSKYIAKKFPDSKMDLFAVFIEKCLALSCKYLAIITQQSWMFLTRYERLRVNLLLNNTIKTTVHLGARAFEEIKGEKVKTVASVFEVEKIQKYKPTFIRLVNFDNYQTKEKEFFNPINKYNQINLDDFSKISGSPIAYWVNKIMLATLQDAKKFETVIDLTGSQHKTANNDKYTREWWEIDNQLIGQTWITYAKGGKFRKWYGNITLLVAWNKQAISFYQHNKTSNMIKENYWFREGITWTATTTSKFSCRVLPPTGVFDIKGPSLFPLDDSMKLFYMGFMNSNVVNYLLNLFSDGQDYQNIDIKRLPIPEHTTESEMMVNELVKENIEFSKKDWDSNEKSLNFKVHPLLNQDTDAKLLKVIFNEWYESSISLFSRLKENEEKINSQFIQLFGVDSELEEWVDKKDIKIEIPNLEKGIRDLISYAVGCMLGRYSLDQEGLVFAGGEFDESKYTTFKADSDNIIPITDDEYFEDDIVSRFIEFVRVTFSEETLEENLDFIAEALGKKANETSRQCIRRYFLKDFFKDHVKTYQKRPIYWLFDSGKNDGFKALIYMHRYDVGTVAQVRTDYLHTLQRKYEAEMTRREVLLESDVSVQEKTRAKKEKEKLQKQLLECQQYDQVIAHVANQKITIDLDDGVKVNYEKFQNVELPQGEGKKPLKANLLAKI